jgi:hypothetical protein
MICEIQRLLKDQPNLKARAIAKELGCDRSKVSSILHSNPVYFIQNDKYEWRLVADDCIITFESRWVDAESFEDSLLDSGLDSESGDDVTFILPNNCKFLLESIGRFLALCNQLGRSGTNVTIDFSKNSKSFHYYNRTGFFDHLDKNVEVIPDRPKKSTAKSYKGNSQNIVEFGSVDPGKENKSLVNELTDRFVSLSTEKYQDPSFTIYSELIRNIQEHSETKTSGFAALQKYKGSGSKPPHIQSIISDCGVGIAATLRPHLKTHYPNLENLSNVDLVKEAMKSGQISKHGSSPESGHGMGFKSSKEKALKFNARYSVRQSDFSLEFIFKNGKMLPIKEMTGLIKIEGTHICFDFDIDGQV